MAEHARSRQDTAMPEPDLADLAESWLVHLRAERKSPATLGIYRAGVRAYLTWCEENGQPAILDRNLLAAFTADLLDQGAEPATAQARHLAVRRFARWLHAEGELAEDPLAGMRPPKLDSKVIPVLSDDELRRLVKACEGRTLRDRRDEALVRLMFESGYEPARSSPCTSRTWTCSAERWWCAAARVAVVGWSRSRPRPPGRSTATRGCGAVTPWPASRTCGWARTPAASATTVCTGRFASAPGRPASRGSARTCSDTPRHRGGWLPGAAKAG